MPGTDISTFRPIDVAVWSFDIAMGLLCVAVFFAFLWASRKPRRRHQR